MSTKSLRACLAHTTGNQTRPPLDEHLTKQGTKRLNEGEQEEVEEDDVEAKDDRGDRKWDEKQGGGCDGNDVAERADEKVGDGGEEVSKIGRTMEVKGRRRKKTEGSMATLRTKKEKSRRKKAMKRCRR